MSTRIFQLNKKLEALWWEETEARPGRTFDHLNVADGRHSSTASTYQNEVHSNFPW